MSKEMYAAPELEVVDLGGEDVICATASGTGGNAGTGDGLEGEGGEDD